MGAGGNQERIGSSGGDTAQKISASPAQNGDQAVGGREVVGRAQEFSELQAGQPNFASHGEHRDKSCIGLSAYGKGGRKKGQTKARAR